MNDSALISLSDLKRLFARSKSHIKRLVYLGILASSLYSFFTPLQFKTKAFFNSGRMKLDETLPRSFSQAVDFISQEHDMSVSLQMTSRPILEKTLQKLGLQADVSYGFIAFFKRPYMRVLSELKFPYKKKELFTFQDISYKGDITQFFYLKPLSFNTYEILDLKKERLCTGDLNTAVTFQGITLSLTEIPRSVSLGQMYKLRISSLESLLQKTKSKLSIKPIKKFPRFLLLNFTHSDPLVSANFLNTLMSTYQDFLREENKKSADIQIAYLQDKYRDLSSKFDHEIEEHASYLKTNLGTQGFISLDQEINLLTPRKEIYLSRLFDVEFELSKFNTQMLVLNQREQKKESLPEQVTQKLPCYETLASLLEGIKNTKTLLESAPKEEKENYTEGFKAAEDRLNSYLKNLSSSLIPPKKTSPKLSLDSLTNHFQGINLKSAQELYTRYKDSLESLHSDITQLSYLQEHLSNDNFTLSSIGSLLSDTVTTNMIHQTTHLESQLKDSLTHSDKERERLKDALKSQTNFLASHLEQIQELKKIQLHLTQEKISSLQKVILDLLKKEKSLLREKLADLHLQMGDLPEKWRFENKLKFRNELTKEIMQGLVQISESKQLASNLYQVDSKPLEKAIPSFSPSPHLIIVLPTTVLIIALVSYIYYFFKTLIRGFPVSAETLKSLKYSVAGSLSPKARDSFLNMTNSDHETLRELSSLAYDYKQKNVLIGLFLGNNPDYSKNLATSLYSRGSRLLILDCDFEHIPSKNETPGLWHCLSGILDTPPIQHHLFFDLIPFGAKLPLYTEIFTQNKFPSFLKNLQSTYDFILVISKTPLNSSHNKDLLNLVDLAFVSFEREPLEDLNFYSNWVRQKQNKYATFVENTPKPFV